MPQLDSRHYDDPLDLLRRFIPAPLKASYRVGTVHVTVKTNDITLLPAFPLEVNLEMLGEQRLEWRLIRDADSTDTLGSPIFMNSRGLTVVGMGPACLIGVDHEKRELLAFIGAAIDSRTHQDFLIPLFCQLTNEVFSITTSSRFEARDEAYEND